MITRQRNDHRLLTRRYALAAGCFLCGQIAVLAAFITCALLYPYGLTVNHGLTYYGVQPQTVIPYRLSFIIPGILSLITALLLPNSRPFPVIKSALWLMVPLMVGVMLTTSYANMEIRILHVRFGESLFFLQAGLAIWLSLFVVRDRVNLLFFLLLLTGGITSLFALYDYLLILVETQFLFQLAFGAIVYYSLRKLQPGLLSD